MYSHIMLPVDLNHKSSWLKALPTAAEYCKVFSANLYVMTVIPDFGMPLVASYFPGSFSEKALADAEKRLQAFVKEHVPDEVATQHLVSRGSIYKEIIRIAKEVNADLIVMASHRPELGDYLLGPNAERVIQHSDKSVLVVRN